MHELSLCENVVQLIEEQAGVKGFRQVRMVQLEIGRLAGVDVDAMRFSFDMVAKNSIVDGAQLKITEIPGTAWCPRCMRHVEVSFRYDECPDCGHHPLDLTGGDQMRIVELEVE